MISTKAQSRLGNANASNADSVQRKARFLREIADLQRQEAESGNALVSAAASGEKAATVERRDGNWEEPSQEQE